jgi:hypothetical protein
LLFPAAWQQIACKYSADTGERRVAMRNRVRRNNAEQYETLKTLENPAQFPHLRKSLICALSSARQNRAMEISHEGAIREFQFPECTDSRSRVKRRLSA